MLVSMDNIKPFFYSRYTHISFPLTPVLNAHVSTERACLEAGKEALPYVCLLPENMALEYALYCELCSVHGPISGQNVTGAEMLNAICAVFGIDPSARVWTLESDSDTPGKQTGLKQNQQSPRKGPRTC